MQTVTELYPLPRVSAQAYRHESWVAGAQPLNVPLYARFATTRNCCANLAGTLSAPAMRSAGSMHASQSFGSKLPGRAVRRDPLDYEARRSQ